MNPEIKTLAEALELVENMFSTLRHRGVRDNIFEKVRREILSRMPMETELGTKYTRQVLPTGWRRQIEEKLEVLWEDESR